MLCDRLRMLISDRGVSRSSLAKEINITNSALGNYIRGSREPDYETLKKIATYFDVTTDFLLDCKIKDIDDEKENELLQIYRALDDDKKFFLLEQARLMLNYIKNPNRGS